MNYYYYSLNPVTPAEVIKAKMFTICILNPTSTCATETG